MKHWWLAHGVVAALVTVLLACGGDVMRTPDPGALGGGAPNATGGGTAGSVTGGGAVSGGGTVGGGSVGSMGGGTVVAAMYPAWQLTDLQPASPRPGQSYGLSAFQGRPLVVVLIEGF